jgi:hypothetical protein
MYVQIFNCLLISVLPAQIQGRDYMVVGLTTTCALCAYITKVESSNCDHGEVYSIQHYVIKFVSDLRQVAGFLRQLRFPPSNNK